MYITSDHIQLHRLLQVTEDSKFIEITLNLSASKIYTYRKEILDRSLEDLKESQHMKKEERVSFILISLLKKRKINLTEITEKLDVTRRIINIDLLEVKEYLLSQNIEVLSLNSKGIFLVGDELAIRELLFNSLCKLLAEYSSLPYHLQDMYLDVFPELYNEKLHSEISKFIKAVGLENSFFRKLVLLSGYFAWTNSDEQFNSEELLGLTSKRFSIKKVFKIMDGNEYFKISNPFFPSFMQLLERHFEDWNWNNRDLEFTEKLKSSLEQFYNIEIHEDFLKKILPIFILSNFRHMLKIKDLGFIDILTQNRIGNNSLKLFKCLSDTIPGLGLYEVEVICQYINLLKILNRKKFSADCIVYDKMPLFLVEEYRKNAEKFLSIEVNSILTLDEFLAGDNSNIQSPITFENHERIISHNISYFNTEKMM